MLSNEQVAQWCDEALKARAAPHAKRTVEDGEVWWSAPPHTPGQIFYSSFGVRNALSSVYIDENFEPLGKTISSTEGGVWLKISVDIGTDELKLHLRPGIVIAGRFPPDRAALVPGFSKPGKARHVDGMPKLEVVYPAGLKESKYPRGYFRFWMPWGVSAKPGVALIAPLTDLKACSSQSGRDYGKAVRRLMEATLGFAKVPSWGPAREPELDDLRSRAKFRRSEVVQLRLSAADPKELAVVISDDLLNGTNPHRLVVLQMVDYRPGDENLQKYVPVDVPGFGRRSVAVPSIRGLTNVTASVKPLKPRVLLNEEAFTHEWSTLTTRLKVAYGE